MTKKSPTYLLLGLSIAALFAVAYILYDAITIINAISNSQNIIQYDSGVYYLLLLSVFWLMSFIEYKGRKNGLESVSSYTGKSIIIWFLVTLLLANIIPFYWQHKFESHGYTACHDPEEINRVARGDSFVMMKGTCEEL